MQHTTSIQIISMPESAVNLAIYNPNKTQAENARLTARELMRRAIEVNTSVKALRLHYTYNITTQALEQIRARHTLVNAVVTVLETMVRELEDAAIAHYLRARDLERT